MGRAVISLALIATVLAVGAGSAGAAGSGWHSEQPVAAGIEVPVPLGEVGDIECWQANRCALIAAGNGGRTVGNGMPAGIYAYDGTGWQLYSTVCGGHRGRIAWAGPDEFWTISDQRPGEEVIGSEPEFWNRSLCHFKNGEVVASYAEPLNQAETYSRMNAAVCEGPNNCWFGGERLSGQPNVGAFHLHWDGFSLESIPSLTVPEAQLEDPGRAVVDMTFDQGRLYESVAVRSGDEPVGETEPTFLHRISLGAARPFEPLTIPGLETGGSAEQVEGFHFARSGAELWGLSGGLGSSQVTMVKREGEAFAQVPLSGGVFQAGDQVNGFAAEPGTGNAWVGYAHTSGISSFALLARVRADGTVDEETVLPGPEEGLNPKGMAGPVVCPAAGQCWMATRQGWLFHLGGSLPQDTDPAMHQLINFRPCDAACRSSNEPGVPEDDSGAEPEADHFALVPEIEPIPTGRGKALPLYNHLKQKLINHRVLQLSFDLHARAHVQLIAKKKKKVVAKTPRLTLDKGHHVVRLRLDPKHWPTHLSFQVHRIKKKAA